jgi:hypothetical protein
MKSLASAILVSAIALLPPSCHADAETHVQFAQSSLEGFQALAVYVQDRNVQKSIDTFIDASEADMLKALEWNGDQAFLVEVRIQSNDAGSVKLLGAPHILGSGKVPENILLSSYRTQYVKPEPDKTYSESLDRSHFLWLRYKKGGIFSKARLERGIIPPEGMKVLKRNVGAALNDIAFSNAREVNEERQRLDASVAHYLAIAKDGARAKALADRVEQLKAHQQQLDAINTRMVEALEQEAQAAKLYESFKVLQSVLTVANMYAQFESALGQKPSSATGEAMTAEAKAYKDRAGTRAAQLSNDRDGVTRAGVGLEREIRDNLRKEGAPDLSFGSRGVFTGRIGPMVVPYSPQGPVSQGPLVPPPH